MIEYTSYELGSLPLPKLCEVVDCDGNAGHFGVYWTDPVGRPVMEVYVCDQHDREIRNEDDRRLVIEPRMVNEMTER